MVLCSFTSGVNPSGMDPPIFSAFRFVSLPCQGYRALNRHLLCDFSGSVSGYLFRTLSSSGKIQNKQIANSTLQSRLRSYLQEAKTYHGETLHSFRAGLATTLAISGSQLADIMQTNCLAPRSYSISLCESCAGFTSRRSFRVIISSRLFCPSPCRLLH